MTAYCPKIKSVEAIQFDTSDLDSARQLTGVASFDHDLDSGEHAVLSMPGHRWREVVNGDWIVRYPSGELRIYVADEFLQFFEPVSIEGGAAS